MNAEYFDQFDDNFFNNLKELSKNNDETFFYELDKILTFSLETDYPSKKVLVIPKTEDITCDGLFDEKAISAKEAFYFVKKEQYSLYITEPLFHSKNCILASWIFKDKIGKAYYKYWKEIINVYRNTTNPIVYTGEKMLPDKNGELENQEWAYKIANGILGLESCDEIKDMFNSNEKLEEAKKYWGCIKD